MGEDGNNNDLPPESSNAPGVLPERTINGRPLFRSANAQRDRCGCKSVERNLKTVVDLQSAHPRKNQTVERRFLVEVQAGNFGRVTVVCPGDDGANKVDGEDAEEQSIEAVTDELSI